MLNNKEEFKTMKQATLNKLNEVKKIDATPNKKEYKTILNFISKHSLNKEARNYARNELNRIGG